jgi:NTE family protein
MGADVVIAVDLGSDVVGRRFKAADPASSSWRQRIGKIFGAPGDAHVASTEAPSLLDVVAGSINIMQVRIARSRLAGEPADVLLAPRLGNVGLFDFHRGEEGVEEGLDAVRVMQPAILRVLGRD